MSLNMDANPAGGPKAITALDSTQARAIKAPKRVTAKRDKTDRTWMISWDWEEKEDEMEKM